MFAERWLDWLLRACIVGSTQRPDGPADEMERLLAYCIQRQLPIAACEDLLARYLAERRPDPGARASQSDGWSPDPFSRGASSSLDPRSLE
jgi:hypothetical protein